MPPIQPKAVGMRQLAERAGVQPGSLYYHIESKQSLLYELIERYESEYLHTIRVVATKPADTIDELVNELWTGLAQFVLKNADLVRLAQNETSNLSTAQREHIHTIRQMRDFELRRLLTVRRTRWPSMTVLNRALQTATEVLDYAVTLYTNADTITRRLIEGQLKELLVKSFCVKAK